ncbi:hypothetical protein FDP41_000827 [Naegleria fowleri]|uniref:Calcineurin-like phosphoesterase domain-containing protein n=1 Tax=Naegleria fowleri TaxID=5763 RepID=A0A6A5CI72_NAEFO|nr:uncharacterized protein FDP41_000827 [Naegleria fowleri]KAF0984928.1 hypothetical protein FDP41_000827 [Naegleria fowleri]CAG4718579.1 unnamed protein product [Naegleria fowleri]
MSLSSRRQRKNTVPMSSSSKILAFNGEDHPLSPLSTFSETEPFHHRHDVHTKDHDFINLESPQMNFNQTQSSSSLRLVILKILNILFDRLDPLSKHVFHRFGSFSKFLLLLVACIVFLEILIFRFQFTYAPHAGFLSDNRSPKFHNILLIGDPQLTDRYSYKFLTSEFSVLSRFIFFICDTFMRKNFQSILRMNRNNIHTIIFLGDLFDNGRQITDDEFEREFARFNSIFENRDSSIKTLYLSGNHDIGLERWPHHVLERFEKYFHTPLNFNYTINNYFKIIGINSMYLNQKGNPVEFISKNIENEFGRNILLTHIPLYRDGNCENVDYNQLLHENARTRPLEQGEGFGYKNMLDSMYSLALLQMTHPLIVLSGDDHEYCKYKHELQEEGFSVYEHTMPTFSMLQGTRKYGYGILTLDLETNTMHGIQVFYMPKVWSIFGFYGVLSVTASVYVIFQFRSMWYYGMALSSALLTWMLCQVWWWLVI